MARSWVGALPVLCVFFRLVDCCGISTHIEISYRAQDGFHSVGSHTDFGRLLMKHQDALEGGSPYPDAFYSPVCFGGKYHNISEDTHWTPFMNATINYIRRHYPPPWDQATEKLVVFLLGVVSHQTADVSWHGMGIDQGFLDAMAAINFHGSFDTAHPIGDVGGDIMTVFEFNVTYMAYLTEWYVPVDDLYNIYTELYGTSLMPKNVIVACTLELYAERLGEKLAIGKLYPDYAGKSDFLVDQLSDYFLGGLDDMAVWTRDVWRKAILMLNRGTGACDLDHNPLFLRCEGQGSKPLTRSHAKPERNGFYSRRRHPEVGRGDVVVRPSLRGVTLQPAHHVQEALLVKEKQQETASLKRKMNQKRLQSSQKMPDAVYSVNSTYAKLGWSMAVGDLDGDGNDDAVIGAPGCHNNGSLQDGAVFILFGGDKGLPLSDLNLMESADVILHGVYSVSGRLGWSVAVVDINLDGVPDIAAGAPSSGSAQLSYGGTVEVFYGVGHRRFVHSMTVSCQERYCNLGRSLAEGDVTGDGFQDLLIGSPFSGGKGDQRGIVTAVVSSEKYADTFVHLNVSALPWRFYGSQNYSWFGESLAALPSPLQPGATLLLVAQPAWRICARANCSFSGGDVQAVGQLNVFTAPRGKPVSLSGRVRGTSGLQRFGSSAAIGRPLPGGAPVLAVGAPGQDVTGSVAGVHLTFPHTGAVWLYNLSSPQQWSPLAVFEGDRRFSRFGTSIKFSDINDDGFDDLIIGAPLRTEDITEEIHAGEEGAAYVYYGGPSFPLGNKATSRCPEFSLVKPCPADTASVVFGFGEDKARFGAQFAVVRSRTKVDVLVTAQHSSRGARLSGAVAVYSFPRR